MKTLTIDAGIRDKQSDLWETPQDLFDSLNQRFNFTIDLCSTGENNKVGKHCKDYFNYNPVSGEVGFMNPPYSNPKPFLEKAYKDSKIMPIVCLIKCDPSTKAWGIFWNYESNCSKPGVTVEFLPKRLKFTHPNVEKTTSAAFPSCIVVMDRRNI